MWGAAPHPEVYRFCFQGGDKRSDAVMHRLPCKTILALRSLLSVALSSSMEKHFHYTVFHFELSVKNFILSLTWGTHYILFYSCGAVFFRPLTDMPVNVQRKTGCGVA